jgi:hypothetical protein
LGPTDVWKFSFEAAWKSIAINTGKVNLLPWEALFYIPGKITNVAETITLSPELVSSAVNVREAAIQFLGDQRLTLKEMIKEISANRKELVRLERSFEIEIEFLINVAPNLLIKTVRHQVIEALPKVGSYSKMPTVPNGIIQHFLGCNDLETVGVFHFVSVLVGLEQIRRSPLCFAGGLELEAEVSGIAGLVRGLMEGVAPSDEFLSACTPFFKTCLKLMEGFVEVTFEKEIGSEADGSPIFEKGNFVGKQALGALFKEFKEALAKGERKTLKEMGVFRTFHWALTPEEKRVSTGWIADAISHHMVGVKQLKDGTAVTDPPLPAVPSAPSGIVTHSLLGVLDDGASASSSAASGSASSTVLVSKATLVHNVSDMISKKGKHDLKKPDAGIMKFFSGKVRPL